MALYSQPTLIRYYEQSHPHQLSLELTQNQISPALKNKLYKLIIQSTHNYQIHSKNHPIITLQFQFTKGKIHENGKI